ncbi:hypothetical protein [Actinoallomurus oryzae]|uniref:hypothetical protein n=1 Tax=Actinoallomurus oryzae TaxID=502180 RepID=UPI0031E63E9F
MKAMTSSAAIRTREDETTGTPPRTTRRGTVPPSRAARPTTTPTGGTSTGTVRERAAGSGAAVTPRAAVTRGTSRPSTRHRGLPPSRTVRPVTAPARAARPARSGAAPFALLVVGLLGGALVGLLLLNTVLAQQSFERSELQQENQRLEERKQALQEDIARESSPEVLHDKARRLGMRDTGDQALTDPRAGR